MTNPHTQSPLVDFREAALFAVTSSMITDPAMPCVAYHVNSDNGYLSTFNQLVRLPGSFTSVVRPVHAIVSQELESFADESYKNNKIDVTKIGSTYAYGATLGVHHLGNHLIGHLARIKWEMTNVWNFKKYMNNFLDTQTGYESMLAMTQSHAPEINGDIFHNIIREHGYDKVKHEHILYCAQLPAADRFKLMDETSGMLIDVYNEQTPDEVNALYVNYLDSDPQHEEQACAEKVAIMQRHRRLYQDFYVID